MLIESEENVDMSGSQYNYVFNVSLWNNEEIVRTLSKSYTLLAYITFS